MLVPNNDAVEKYITSKNNDIVYNCQISEDDLTNPYLFDDIIDYHYITYLNDRKDLNEDLLNTNNSEILSNTTNTHDKHDKEKKVK